MINFSHWIEWSSLIMYDCILIHNEVKTYSSLMKYHDHVILALKSVDWSSWMVTFKCLHGAAYSVAFQEDYQEFKQDMA